jgi:hypothetical protein
VTEPRVTPAVQDIWQHVLKAGPNADAMAQDLISEAGLPMDEGRRVPDGFAIEDQS